ncbi:PEPxxWA-CTERM sorting domain-containing protein [Phenylobacterium sp.]|uniref:PEPxxWA-CTERM sorting domain-containing protein n=1 Tax=Phenylobacterium sp. TaxID=1871053 RepID=UPI00301CB831
MHKMILAAAAAAALSGAPAAAHATTTIDFDEHAGTTLNRGIGTSFESGGLRFDYSGASQFWVFGTTHTWNADPGGATIRAADGGLATVSKVGGGAFDLLSIDLADQANTGFPAVVQFIFYYADDTLGEIFTLDTLQGLQTLTLDRRNLISFSFRGVGTTSTPQFDNLVWRESAVAAVPEPMTWALMITGFAGVGAAIRRQRHRVLQPA